MKLPSITKELELVRLASKRYAVDQGTLGIITMYHEGDLVEVTWIRDPGPGGTSVPVRREDLDRIGKLAVPIQINVE